MTAKNTMCSIIFVAVALTAVPRVVDAHKTRNLVFGPVTKKGRYYSVKVRSPDIVRTGHHSSTLVPVVVILRMDKRRGKNGRETFSQPRHCYLTSTEGFYTNIRGDVLKAAAPYAQGPVDRTLKAAIGYKSWTSKTVSPEEKAAVETAVLNLEASHAAKIAKTE